MWKPAVVCVCLSLLVLMTASIRAADETRPLASVAVRLINHDPALGAGVGIAQALVERLFRHAGVRVDWIGSDDSMRRGPLFTLMISTSPDDQRHKEEFAGVLGVTPSGRGGDRGTFARVFGDRVRAFAQAQAIDAASLLGCVIAHELGHLLLPVNAHATGGIMMPIWSPRLLPPYAPVPGFLSFQADLIRLRLAEQGGGLATASRDPLSVANN